MGPVPLPAATTTTATAKTTATQPTENQYFLSREENVVFLVTTHGNSGLTRRELSCVVTRNETLSMYRNCILYTSPWASFMWKFMSGTLDPRKRVSTGMAQIELLIDFKQPTTLITFLLHSFSSQLHKILSHSNRWNCRSAEIAHEKSVQAFFFTGLQLFEMMMSSMPKWWHYLNTYNT